MTGGDLPAQLAELPEYLLAMVRRLPPGGIPVVSGSTPVVAFGDPARAEVATLGINPSANEFLQYGRLLTGAQRRLATVESLGAQRVDQLTEAQVATLVADCATYFQHERWPSLATVQVRFRGRFAYVNGELEGGEVVPLCRLRYAGSASRWGFAIYLASRDGYEDSLLPSGLHAGAPEEALDCACGLYLNDPSAWQQPPPSTNH